MRIAEGMLLIANGWWPSELAQETLSIALDLRFALAGSRDRRGGALRVRTAATAPSLKDVILIIELVEPGSCARRS
jgi:hypothetical protein